MSIHIAVGGARGSQSVGRKIFWPPIYDQEEDDELIRRLHQQMLPHGPIYQGLIPAVWLL